LPKNTCWEKASKTISVFAPAAPVENYGNWIAGDAGVRDADTHLMTSQVDG